MSTPLLPDDISNKVAALYAEMEEQYDVVARELAFTCSGCSDNCCDSYFQHHTYLEWAYLWQGLMQLSEQERQAVIQRAHDYDAKAKEAEAQDERPQEMCPLCEGGLCMVYQHRLLICRLHGVPATLTHPDGKKVTFQGCFRCQEIIAEAKDVPRMDRTEFFNEFFALGNEWLGVKKYVLPKIKMTIAEMIIKGEPDFSFCDY